MIYNIHYDICALIVFIFMMWCILIKKGIRKTQNRLFFILILIGLYTTVFDILSAIAISYPNQYSVIVRDILNYLYLIGHNAMPFAFCLYVVVVSGAYLKKKWTFFAVLAIPFVANYIVLLSNIFTRLVFFYNEEGFYTHGVLFSWLHLSALFYVLLSIYLFVKNACAIPRTKKRASIVFTSLGFLATMLQLAYPEMLSSLFVQSVAFLGILLNIESKCEIVSPVTKVYNRHAFLLDNTMLINHEVDYQVLSIRFTNLKHYNATLGIVQMNYVLRDVAKWLTAAVPEGIVYDCDNGEFSIVIYKTDRIDVLKKKIQDKFSREWKYGDIFIAFHTQICVIRIPENVSTLEKLLTAIDADYKKSDNAVAVIRAEQLSDMQREIQINKAMQKAIDKHSFQVYYQPIWERETNTIHSAEALVRLFDDELGFIPPDEFIPIAEKNGMIAEIGIFVFEEVCRFIYEGNLEKHNLQFIEINLSTVQCMHMHLTKTFRGILHKYRVDASKINLEITESAAINSPEMFMDTMKELRELGFTFSMDDYGTGYSNFSYMFDMEFDIIKLDKSILWNAEKNENAGIILRNTIRMLKEMNFQIVVEGVETEAQKQHVSELGCDYCQGYYFSKPVEKEKFMEYCMKYNFA